MVLPGVPCAHASVIPPPDGAPRPMPFVHTPMQQTCRRRARRRRQALLWLCLGAACSRPPQSDRASDAADAAPPAGATLFTRLPSSSTGVKFANNLTESSELNVFTYRNFYNGGGVAIGDLTGDGLPEIVLTSNQGGAHLYLNLGQFKFRDVTAAAGLDAKRAWTTGVTLADVDGDGKLDIYLSHAGQGEPAARRNTLWINQGLGADSVPTFREEGEQFGVADEGYTTQAAFFDYDRDGDLDLFLINNSPRPVSSFGQRNTRNVRDPYGGDKLYRNDNGHFTDVSASAGIFGSEVAFGLGLGIADVNRDGWPDIYVSNDFFERDYLYLNKHDGTFEEALDRSTTVDSYFSMGMDIADVDNDGWPDIYTTDMLPENEYRLRTMSSFEGWDVYQAKVANGYGHQYMRNMLQRNEGDGTFTDIGQMAGVARTDWSWSALIADLDLDGRKDIFVTNGLVKDVTSQDYIAFLANQETMDDATSRGKVDYLKLINAMKSTPIPNYAFRNNGGAGVQQRGGGVGARYPVVLQRLGLRRPRWRRRPRPGGEQHQRGSLRLSQQRAHAWRRPTIGCSCASRERGRTRYAIGARVLAAGGERHDGAGSEPHARLPVVGGLRAHLRARRARLGVAAARGMARRQGERARPRRSWAAAGDRRRRRRRRWRPSRSPPALRLAA